VKIDDKAISEILVADPDLKSSAETGHTEELGGGGGGGGGGGLFKLFLSDLKG
jgi:hypothetical protein